MAPCVTRYMAVVWGLGLIKKHLKSKQRIRIIDKQNKKPSRVLL